MRHDSISDSSMHCVMPVSHLSMVRSHSSSSHACESGLAAMRFGSSVPMQGALLSELQAQRAMDGSDREPEMWQQCLQNQVHTFSALPDFCSWSSYTCAPCCKHASDSQQNSRLAVLQPVPCLQHGLIGTQVHTLDVFCNGHQILS